MHITIDREPRGAKEGIALNVVARQNEDDIYQFKIDVWSEKGSGLYRLRLDGFNFLRYIEASSPQEVFLFLHNIDSADVEAKATLFYQKIRQSLKDAPSGLFPATFALPDPSELAVAEYFRAAQAAMLKELAPLMQTGQN
jgi:hypothetical protein